MAFSSPNSLGFRVNFGQAFVSYDVMGDLPVARVQKIADEEAQTLRKAILGRVQRGTFFAGSTDYSTRRYFTGLNRRFHSPRRRQVWESRIVPAAHRRFKVTRGGNVSGVSYKGFKSVVGSTREEDIGGFRFKPQGGSRVDLFLTGQMLRDLRVKATMKLPNRNAGDFELKGTPGSLQRKVFNLSFGVIFEVGFAGKESATIASGFHDSSRPQYRPFAYFTSEDVSSVRGAFGDRLSEDSVRYAAGGGSFVGRSASRGFHRIDF